MSSNYSHIILICMLILCGMLSSLSAIASNRTLNFNSESLNDTTQIKIYIEGMSCMRCKQKIEKKVSSIDGVRTVNVFLEEKYTIVIFENKKTKIEAIIAKIEDSGYTVKHHEIIKSIKG